VGGCAFIEELAVPARQPSIRSQRMQSVGQFLIASLTFIRWIGVQVNDLDEARIVDPKHLGAERNTAFARGCNRRVRRRVYSCQLFLPTPRPGNIASAGRQGGRWGRRSGSQGIRAGGSGHRLADVTAEL